ncbi:MAG: hypothetical protein NZM27_12895 [Acetobacteraceae bacterium]|nr:hypothetical protein [Acetobacteraceae bacterium]
MTWEEVPLPFEPKRTAPGRARAAASRSAMVRKAEAAETATALGTAAISPRWVKEASGS